VAPSTDGQDILHHFTVHASWLHHEIQLSLLPLQKTPSPQTLHSFSQARKKARARLGNAGTNKDARAQVIWGEIPLAHICGVPSLVCVAPKYAGKKRRACWSKWKSCFAIKNVFGKLLRYFLEMP
jgi:hypothetical protein